MRNRNRPIIRWLLIVGVSVAGTIGALELMSTDFKFENPYRGINPSNK